MPTSRRRSTRGTRGLLSRTSSVVAKALVVPLRPARPRPSSRPRPASARSAKVRSLIGHRPTYNQANRLKQQTTTTAPAKPPPVPTKPLPRKRRRPRRPARSRSRRPKPTTTPKKSLQGALSKRSRPMRPASSSRRATSRRSLSSRPRCFTWGETGVQGLVECTCPSRCWEEWMRMVSHREYG